MHPTLIIDQCHHRSWELVTRSKTNCGNECTRGADKLTVVIDHALIRISSSTVASVQTLARSLNFHNLCVV